MDELDARLRAMAKREDWALPAAYESAMDGLEEQIRQGGTLDRPGKRRLGKRVLILAAIVAVLLAATAVSMDFWNVRVEDVLVGQESSSYRVNGEIPVIPLESFSDEVASAMEDVSQKMEEQDLYLNSSPGYWLRTFDRWADCEEFIGFPLNNPLEKSSLLETANYFAIAQDAETLNEESQRHCAVALHGNLKGELQHVTIDTGYLMGPIRIQMTVSLYPEGSGMEPGTGGSWNGEAEFEITSGVTGEGIPYTLVVSETPESDYYNDFSSADAYFVLKNGLYTLDAVSPGRDSGADAKAALEELLALF